MCASAIDISFYMDKATHHHRSSIYPFFIPNTLSNTTLRLPSKDKEIEGDNIQIDLKAITLHRKDKGIRIGKYSRGEEELVDRTD